MLKFNYILPYIKFFSNFTSVTVYALSQYNNNITYIHILLFLEFLLILFLLVCIASWSFYIRLYLNCFWQERLPFIFYFWINFNLNLKKAAHGRQATTPKWHPWLAWAQIAQCNSGRVPLPVAFIFTLSVIQGGPTLSKKQSRLEITLRQTNALSKNILNSFFSKHLQ